MEFCSFCVALLAWWLSVLLSLCVSGTTHSICLFPSLPCNSPPAVPPQNLSCGHCHPLIFTPAPHPVPVPAGPEGPRQVDLSQKGCWCLCCAGGWRLDWRLLSVLPRPLLKGISTVVTKFICEEKPQKNPKKPTTKKGV